MLFLWLSNWIEKAEDVVDNSVALEVQLVCSEVKVNRSQFASMRERKKPLVLIDRVLDSKTWKSYLTIEEHNPSISYYRVLDFNKT